MPAPSVTYTFSNGAASDATQVNQNFTDIINGITDGTKDLAINALTCAGNVTLNGTTTTIGNATSDDLVITASLASTVNIKTTNSYDIGTTTKGLQRIYFGSSAGSNTSRLNGAAVTGDVVITLPSTTGTLALNVDAFAAKAATYTATTADNNLSLSGASFTVTLPTAVGNTGKTFTFFHTGTSLTQVYTIDGDGTETIGGSTTYPLYTDGEVLKIVSNGANWLVVEHYAETAWASAGTLTISGTGSAPTKGSTQTHDVIRWRRSGENAFFRMNFRQTNATSSAAGSGDYLFAVTAVGSIDTNKVDVYATAEGWNSTAQNAFLVGGAEVHDSTNDFIGSVIPYDASYVRVFGHLNSAVCGVIGELGFPLTQTNVMYSLDFSVPMANWKP